MYPKKLTMNKIETTLLFIALAAMLHPGVAAADDVEVSYDAGVYSHYVWRGLALTDDPSFQPSVTVSHASGFSLNVWGALDLGNVNGHDGEFTELDWTLAYGQDFGDSGASWELGLIWYTFPNVATDTQEVYFSLGFGGVVSPSVTVYYDFGEVDGFYATAGLEYGNEIGEDWSYTLAASVGFAGDDFATRLSGGVDGGPHDGNVSLSIDYSGDPVGVGFMVAYTDSLDNDTLPDQPVDLWGGVYVSIGF